LAFLVPPPPTAVEASLGASDQIDHLTPFIGVIKGAPPRLSESIDGVPLTLD
jgi:hypothetical protein